MNKYKNLTLLFLLISSGVKAQELTETDTQDNYGHTALTWAVLKEDCHTLHVLLGNEAGVNAKTNEERLQTQLNEKLVDAAYRQDILTLTKALEQGADVNAQNRCDRTALSWVIKHGRLDMMEVLLDYKVDVHARDNSGKTPFLWTAQYGQLEMMEILIRDFKVDVHAQDKSGHTALHWVAIWGYLEILRILLANEVDVNVQNIYGDTALMLAVKYEQFEIVEVLVAHGADVNVQKSHGTTALLISIEKDFKIMKVLLVHGADVNAKYFSNGKTALMVAASQERLEVVEALVEYEADVHAQDNEGWTALHWAWNHDEIIEVLKEAERAERKPFSKIKSFFHNVF